MKLKSIIAALALFTFVAAADSPAQVKAALSNQMSTYAAAIKAKDAVQVEKIIRANFAPEFKDVGAKGRTMNLEQTIAQMKLNVSTLKTVKTVKLTIVDVKVNGDKATTKEVFALDAVIANPAEPTKTHTLKVDSAWNGTYVKRKGRWWCTKSATTKEAVLFDGKKMG